MKKFNVTITNEEVVQQFKLMEALFGKTKNFDGFGELLAQNPTAEELAPLDPNFQGAYDDGRLPEIVDGVVYFDAGANRAFLIDEEDVEIAEVN